MQRPIAVVGIGLRFPGSIGTPSELFQRLVDRHDAIVDVPAERWDPRRFCDADARRAGKMYVREGGFLARPLDDFDPLAFGISPREAQAQDPQQRLLLEVAWECLDDAGLRQEDLRGGRVGVFVGGFAMDQMLKNFSYENHHRIDHHAAASASLTMLANRISHVFDFRGPSVSMDTACSSSLVALHFACRSLSSGDCDLALVGGVNYMTQPGFPIAMCKGGFLSPLGRCMAFDERAAGYVRGEGAGLVALKPLDRAIADRDRVYASVLATGANQDGRTPGITLPRQSAQADLARQVLAEAGVDPRDIRYVEAHGTGTQAGDTAEAAALEEVLGKVRDRGDPLWVGSIKTNIGHLEAAAGVAGLIKTALVLHHQKVPPNLHFERPNPRIPFDAMHLQVVTETTPLRPRAGTGAGAPLLSAVNAFGYGGSNAHAILAQAPPRPTQRSVAKASQPTPVDVGPAGHGSAGHGSAGHGSAGHALFLMPLSAQSESALRARAGDIAAQVDRGVALEDLGHTLVHRTSHLGERLAVVADSRHQLRARLADFAAGQRIPGVAHGRVQHGRVQHGRVQQTAAPRIAFIYSGMGPQWWAMGRALFETEPACADALARFDALFAPMAGWSIHKAMLADEPCSRMARTEVAQAANFALQYALTCLFAHYGIEASAFVGHSVGEVASAWASGALSLPEAVQVSYERSRLQAAIAHGAVEPGAMLAAGIEEDEACRWAAELPGLAVAAVNAPMNVTLSGHPDAVAEAERRLAQRGAFYRRLDVEVAYHSHYMDPIAPHLEAALAGLRGRAVPTTLYSTVAGAPIRGSDIDAGYWCRNARQPVRFQRALEAMLDDGLRVFVEVGPHPVLRSAVHAIARARNADIVLLPSLRRDQPAPRRFFETLGGLYAAGRAPDLRATTPVGGRFVRLPAYPWQRQPCSQPRSPLALGGVEKGHPLLQLRKPVARPTWASELTAAFLPWLPDHRVSDEVVLPGAAYLEAAVAMVRAELGAEDVVLRDVDFESMLALPPDEVRDLNLTYDPASGRFEIASVRRGRTEATRHARGWAHPAASEEALYVGRPAEVDAPFDVDALYPALERRGLCYGPAFRTLIAGQVRPDGARAKLRLRPEEAAELGPWAGEDGYTIHPALLDGAFQAAVAATGLEGRASFVPVGVDKMWVKGFPSGPVLLGETAAQEASASRGEASVDLQVIRRSERELCVDLSLSDADGQPRAVLRGVTLRPLPAADPKPQRHYTTEWVALPEPVRAEGSPPACLVVAEDARLAERLAAELSRSGARTDTRAEGIAAVREAASSSRWWDRLIVVATAEPAQLGARLWALACHLRAVPVGVPVDVVWVDAGGSGSVALSPGPSLAGLLGVLRNETPGLELRLLELSDAGPARLSAAAAHLLAPSAEAHIRLGPSGRFAPRLSPQTSEPSPPRATVDPATTPVRLETLRRHKLGSLGYVLDKTRSPGPHEVVIRVETSVLNFKDVLKWSGRLDPRITRDTYFGEAKGMECAGVITQLGAAIDDLELGQPVLAFPADGTFRSQVVVHRDHVGAIPRGIGPEEAVALGSAYLTAWYGLHQVARITAADSILIHSATGGVGLMAVELAQRVGARVLASAGTEDKRAWLRDRGIETVVDSRSPAFAEAVRRASGGEGVDVILGAVSGRLLTESLDLLRPSGRYVDLGKQALVGNEALPLRAFSRGLTYAAIDVDRLMKQRPVWGRDRIVDGLRKRAADRLRAPHIQRYPAARAKDAFLTMARGEHVGRIVLDFRGAKLDVQVDRPLVRRDGTYVITGGTGGFGLVLARWLAERGAGALVLLSRRGEGAEGVSDALRRFRSSGTEAVAWAADVGDEASLTQVFERAARELPPIRGIFHSAMVLDDALVADLDEKRWRAVWRPKAEGAMHLDRLSDRLPLDHFVLFSSVAVAIANPGQANYVAANAFVDALAAHRRAKGQPGLSIQWGVLGDTGVAARKGLLDQLEGLGMKRMSNAAALRALETALRDAQYRRPPAEGPPAQGGNDRSPSPGSSSEPSVWGCFAVDWDRLFARVPGLANQPFFERVRAHAGGDSEPTLALLRELEQADPSTWHGTVLNLLTELIGSALNVDPGRIDPNQPLGALGLDSLVAAELVQTLNARGFAANAATLMRGPTTEALCRQALLRLREVSEADKVEEAAHGTKRALFA